ncbi:FMN-binding negative transcriptional regulator [Colwellia psychrerythraea]|uniref:FMN-binding negative transcriptional regulator n=1 Tax=Colwellia psychrerythraea TaxID=28229 RepID=A0A099KRP3_COLPS|nr:FMN-binding negative transcriptional regulator [Colwellia psychrerythraea]KGJ93429.1 FMN-binding negative transcriptional regulator [Colwellia psychrerythraea]
MYPAKHYQASKENISHYHDIIENNPLATLLFNHKSEIDVSHIPCHFSLKTSSSTIHELERNTLTAHVSNHHPLAEVLKHSSTVALQLIFHGEDAYISPRDVAKQHNQAQSVPTWNYAKVHVSGIAREIKNSDEKYRYMAASTAYFEHRLGSNNRTKPWSIEEAPAIAIQKMLNAITVFDITITHLEGRFKLSQNKPKAVQKELAEQLTTRGAQDLGQLMLAL